jgi:hypothetical protein
LQTGCGEAAPDKTKMGSDGSGHFRPRLELGKNCRFVDLIFGRGEFRVEALGSTAHMDNSEKPKLIHPRAGERGMTELHYAAYCQNLSRVRECVEAGFDVNQKDDAGYTPLAWCVDMAATGDVGAAESIVDYLVEHGANLEFSDERYRNLLELARACDDRVAEHIGTLLKQ